MCATFLTSYTKPTETDKPMFSKYMSNLITSIHCSLIWYYDSNIVSTLYIYPTQSIKFIIKCLSLLSNSNYDNFDMVNFRSGQCGKLNFWQKSLLYRILKNKDKLVNSF